jgi:hypothetical protein
VLAADYPFLDLMWTMVVFFLWIVWFWLLSRSSWTSSAAVTYPAGERRPG